MTRLRFRIAISLDGFTAGPHQSVDEPLGVGGEHLHDWIIPLAAWREMQGLEGGIVDASTPVMEEMLENNGATIMGRNMFGGYPGEWNRASPWIGWWGKNPPFHHPVFVITHYPREPLTLDGGTTFNFVTDGIGAALEQATRAAKGKDVILAGGADVARQYLGAGLVDEMLLSLAPILLGDGERLFEGITDLAGLSLANTVAAPNVTHLKFVKQ